MNTNLNSTSQFSNDADVFAYRGQAARLRSEEMRKLLSRFAAWFGMAKAKVANNTGRQIECEAC